MAITPSQTGLGERHRGATCDRAQWVGIIADKFGLSEAIISIAALTFISGVVVAVLMRERTAGFG
jgi:hypothetical protein